MSLDSPSIASRISDSFAIHGASAAFGTSLRTGAGCVSGGDCAPLTAAGIGVGHASTADTGVTVLVCPEGAIAAVDVRGGGPGTRETDLLAPENTVERVNAIVLSGGSAFGLAAADGVMRELAERKLGFQVTPEFPDIIVPIVPGAVIFDLLLGSPVTPDANLGRKAVSAALSSLDDATPSESGCVGAGVGAMAGAIKGGLGQSCVRDSSGTWVAAVMVANPFGAVIDPLGRLYGNPELPPVSDAALAQLNQVFVGRSKVMRPTASDAGGDAAGGIDASVVKRNTTIGCVITNAPLTTSQVKRLAMCAHDGLARAIRPAHAPMDGDTIFALSAPDRAEAENAAQAGAVAPEQMALLTAMAADAVQFAIVDAVVSASTRAGVSAYRDLIGHAAEPSVEEACTEEVTEKDGK